MRRDQLPPHKTATYVMRRWRAVYVSVNKAACTSLKWLVADLQGERPERFHRSLSREVSRTMTIHRRSLWRHTPMAARLPESELAAISPDDGWFVFGVVRHPTARLFSAWQSKLLLREPWWVEQFGHEPWWPRVPASSDDIVEDWMRFVRALEQHPQQRIAINRHFAPQHGMLAMDRMPYTRIYRTSEIPQLLHDFEQHLRELGWDGDRLELLRANETPLRPIRSMFPPEVLATSRALYDADFTAFGYEDVMPTSVDVADHYPETAVAEIGRLIERAERINDLALRAREHRRPPKRRPQPLAAPSRDPVRSARRLARRARDRWTGNARPPRATMHYLDFLAAFHERFAPTTYLEIGVRHGDSLAMARCRAIGIDPEPTLRTAPAESASVFQESSDEYFTRGDPLGPLGGAPVDLAFIDGMHLAEFALRDFINVERHSRWTSAIIFDDIFPHNPRMAARDRRTRAWTGDVYKLLRILPRYRPDLVTVRVNTKPTGLLLVMGLDPESGVLSRHYDGIVETVVVPDPQRVPRQVISRRGAIDPQAVLASPLLAELRAARTANVPRRTGVKALRRAVRRRRLRPVRFAPV